MNRLTQKKQKARNFARAFLRTHSIAEEELFAGIDVLYQQDRVVFHLLELSSAHIEEKYAAIDQLGQRLHIPKPLCELLCAVLRYKEFELLPCILVMLKEEFKRMQGIHEVCISSPVPLSDQNKARIESLVRQKIPGLLRFLYRSDPALIAGFKIETPLYYWEHSVARTIRQMQQQLRVQELV